MNIEPVRETLIWHLLYLSNVYIAIIDEWPGTVSHLWTLSVEEQFYLVWPFVIWFLPRRLLPAALIGIIASALIFRVTWRAAGLGDLGASLLPPGSFDALAMGSLLALLRHRERLIAVVGLTGLCIWVAAVFWAPVASLWIVQEAELAITAAGMFFVWVVARAAGGFGGIVGLVLNNPVLRYLGVISYGIYIFHRFAPEYLVVTGLAPHLTGWLFVSTVAVTLLLAALSWHLVERPIMRAGRQRLAAAIAT